MQYLIDIIYDLFLNFPLMIAALSLVVAQTVKIFYYYFKDGEINLWHFIEASGMPSAHAAIVSSLTLAIGLIHGFSTALFGASLIFSCIVMYDAAGVRRAAGKQALILNRVVEDIYKTGKVSNGKLKELMGHSPFEVVVGAVLGIAIAASMFVLIY